MSRLVLLAMLLGCSHVSSERCMEFQLRSLRCESGDDALSASSRETLRGAYCNTDVDRDSISDLLDCVEQPTCEAFEHCVHPHGAPRSPFGVPR